MHRFHLIGVIAALSCALVSSACGSSTKPAQSAPAADTKPWLSTLIDENQDAQFRIRPQDAEKDPVFGAIMQRAEDQLAPVLAMMPLARSAFATFEKSSLVIIATRRADPLDAVIIFEGVPDAQSPATMLDPNGAPLLKRIEGTPITVDEYEPTKKDDGNAHSPMAIQLAKVNQMWVVGLGAAADRVDAAVKSEKMEELHADSGPILAMTGAGDFLETIKKGDHPPMIQPVLDGLARVDMDVEGGQSTHVKIAMTYGNESDATRAKDFVELQLRAAKDQKPELKTAIDGMMLTREATKVSLDAPLSPEFLQAVMQRPHDGGGDAVAGGGAGGFPQQGTGSAPPPKKHPKKPKH
ncbi:MAG: hypothetical protein ABI183_16815 [Polyangiaceae bacterium]